jgi:hypothetical protein
MYAYWQNEVLKLDELYNEIMRLVKDITKQNGMPFELGAFSAIGWRHDSSNDTPMPYISIKKQKNAVHVYYSFWKFNEAEKRHFVSVFGKSAIGKSCIRIRKMTVERKETLTFIINRCKDI